ncbi:hypothetical protein K7432_009023 [Basidiobolus ranarum]|uniref:Uncharacterized protein n=1 Tax=Basidiobolus ranarum TaxID=34480 RepID=A0ABR2VXQ5_9FUNG
MCPPNFQWGLNGSLLATLPFTELPALTTDSTPPLSAPIFNFPNINSNFGSTSPERRDSSISLREIIDRFADKPETMDLLLKAKMEEDRRLTEQYRYKIELAREETKKNELKILNHQQQHPHHHHSHSGLGTNSDHLDDMSSDDNSSSVNLDPYNDPHMPTQPLTPPASGDENGFMDSPLDSKSDYGLDTPPSGQPMSVSMGIDDSKKRKATPEFPIEYCVMMDSKQRTSNSSHSTNPHAPVTMETVQRKVRIKQMNKKERPQQKFMQMMKLVNSKN